MRCISCPPLQQNWSPLHSVPPLSRNGNPNEQGENTIRTFNSSHRASLLINNSPRMDYYLLPTTYYLLPTTYYLLPTTYYLLPTTYYLLPLLHNVKFSK